MKRWHEHLVVIATLLALSAVGTLGAWRSIVSDWRFGFSKKAPSGDVIVVGIDAASLAAVGVWPWPRTIHAQLLTKLHDAGALEVAFDVDFSSKSNTVADSVFAQSLAQAGGGTILPVFKQVSRSAEGEAQYLSTKPLPAFEEHAWLGAVNISPDRDGLVRRYPVGLEIAGSYYPSLASLLAGTTEQLERSFLLDYAIDIRKIPRLSAIDVLEGQAGDLSGKKVIIGATAIELGDHFAVPKFGIVPGVALQALAAEASLHGRMLQQTGWPLTLAGLAVIVILADVLSRITSAKWTTAALLGTGLCLEAGAQMLQAQAPLSVDTSAWLVALAGYGACTWLRELDVRSVLAAVAQRRFQSVAMNLADGVICLDEAGHITFWNPAAVKIFACPGSDAMGKDLGGFIKGGRSAVDGAFNAHAKGGHAVELTGRRMDGSEFPLEMRLSTWEAEHGQGTSVIVRDITARRQAEARIRHLAMRDGLTDLANRTSLCDDIRFRIDHSAAGTRFGVFLIDLDNFKEVNDKLGHEGGDALLRRFANDLRTRLSPDDCVARLGGDEFAVVSDLSRTTIATVADTIASVLGQGDRYTFVDGCAFLLSASTGSAVFPDDGRTVDELLSNSDLALYRAKSNGHALHVSYAPEFKDEVDSRRQLEADLRRAHDNGELVAFFQPQAGLSDGSIVGVEALIRWQHPRKGLIQPAAFLPVLTTSPIAADVGYSIMRQSCLEAARWASHGHEIRVGVNLFPAQFNSELPEVITKILEETGLAPRLLEIEITENILLTDDEKTISLLREVRTLGVGVALDDFGTGFASLTHLKRFPLDRLKIDRSFVTTFGSDHANTAIVTAIVRLAHELGLETIAEGIEDADCAQLLSATGCKEGQGYHFGKPMTGDDLVAGLEGATSPNEAAA